MNSESLSCKICYLHFDLDSRLPRLIPTCGHSFCSACLTRLIAEDNLKKCPLDKRSTHPSNKTIDDYPINFSLKPLIEEFLTTETCQLHQEDKSLLCVTDQNLICDQCAILGGHAGHELKPIQQIKSVLDTKRVTLEEAVKKIDGYCEGMVNIVDRARESYKSTLKCRFDELKQAVAAREAELTGKLDDFFNAEKEEIYSSLIKLYSLKYELASKASNYKELFKHPDFLQHLNEDVSQIIPEMSLDFTPSVQQYEIAIEPLITSWDDYLVKPASRLSEIIFPSEDVKEILSKLPRDVFKSPSSGISNIIQNSLTVETICEYTREKNTISITLAKKERESLKIDPELLQGLQSVLLNISTDSIEKQDMLALHHIYGAFNTMLAHKISCSDTHVHNDRLANIFYMLSSKLTDIEDFKLDLNSCTNINDAGLSFLMNFLLQSATKLKKLGLILTSTKITDQSINALHRSLQKLAPSLTHIDISLNETKITDQSISRLFVPMPLLTQLYLYLKFCDITDEGILALAQQIMPTLRNLQEFCFDLSCTKITDRSAKSLLANVKNLRILRIAFGSTNISKDFLKFFGQECLPQMRLLEDLMLVLFGMPLEDRDVKHICVPFENLKVLCIALQSTRITDQSLKLIAETMLSSVQNFEKVTLRFNNTRISDSGALCVLERFKNMSSVQKFILGFAQTRVTNEVGQRFLDAILPEMRSLKDFDLAVCETEVDRDMLMNLEVARKDLIERNRNEAD